MNVHTLLVWIPGPLLILALLLDLLRSDGWEQGNGRPWSRRLVATATLVAVLAAFTGLSARRTLPASVPGSPMPPWDVHVNVALALLVPILILAFIRIRAVGRRWEEARGRIVLLDLGLLLLVLLATVTGLQIP